MRTMKTNHSAKKQPNSSCQLICILVEKNMVLGKKLLLNHAYLFTFTDLLLLTHSKIF